MLSHQYFTNNNYQKDQEKAIEVYVSKIISFQVNNWLNLKIITHNLNLSRFKVKS